MLKTNGKLVFQRWLLLPVLAIVCFITSEILSRNAEFVEKYYSQSFYPIVAKLLSKLSSVVPFSLDDIFYLLLLLAPFILIVLLVARKISFKYAGKIIVNILAFVYIMFYVLWGFNYLRPALSNRLELNSSKPDKNIFLGILENLIYETNHLQCSFETSDEDSVNLFIEKSYQNLADVLKLQYPMGIRNDKEITFSRFYAQTGISGYFGPFFNEVHVNKKVLPIEYPFVLAHEKAHQFGITSEAEANFYAWLVCTQSKSQQVQYSANLIVLRHFLIQAYQMEEFPDLFTQINNSVKTDFRTIQEHWRKLRHEKMGKAASRVNDVYLKSNKVKEGIKDYRGVVEHVMNFSLDSTFQESHNLVVK